MDRFSDEEKNTFERSLKGDNFLDIDSELRSFQAVEPYYYYALATDIYTRQVSK